jgi:hypothetical protein
LTTFALRDRLEKHAFRFSIGLEGLLPFRHQDGYRCTLGKFRIVKFHSTINDPTGGHSHLRILVDLPHVTRLAAKR